MLKYISKSFNEFKDESKANAIEFEKMACDVLNEIDSSSDDDINKIVLQKIPYYSINCLEMGFKAKCLSFMALPCVESLIHDIWMGKIQLDNVLMKVIKSKLNLFI